MAFRKLMCTKIFDNRFLDYLIKATYFDYFRYTKYFTIVIHHLEVAIA